MLTRWPFEGLNYCSKATAPEKVRNAADVDTKMMRAMRPLSAPKRSANMDTLLALGRAATKIMLDGKKVDLQLVLDDIADNVDRNLRGTRPSRSLSSRSKTPMRDGIRHSLINADTMLDEIDHGQAKVTGLGTAYKAIKMQIDKALDRIDEDTPLVAAALCPAAFCTKTSDQPITSRAAARVSRITVRDVIAVSFQRNTG